MKRFLRPAEHSTPVDLALLVLRVAAGVAFVVHGSFKIENPFGWMGPQGFAPPVFQALAAIAEFGGGIGWILGLLTPLSSFGIACTMTVAASSMAIRMGAPFVSNTGGPSTELAVAYFCMALLLLSTGPGQFSLDRRIFGR
jgi:putative oxidoreductase